MSCTTSEHSLPQPQGIPAVQTRDAQTFSLKGPKSQWDPGLRVKYNITFACNKIKGENEDNCLIYCVNA